MRMKGAGLVVAALLALVARPAFSVILPEGSAAQKQRRDIGKQVAKYVICLVKAAQKCEANGDEADQECFLATGMVQGGDPNLDQADFQERIAKCESKLDFAKKSPSDGTFPVSEYEAIGCPGDSVPGGSDQRYTDMNAYQVGAIASGKSQLDTLSSLLCVLACAGSCADDSQANLDCLTADAKELTKYAKGIQKCEDKCEKDYDVPDSDGGGGPSDSASICSVGGVGDSDFDACTATPAGKLAAKASAGANSGVKPAVDAALDSASNDLYNECDCGAGVGPCP